LDHIKLLPDVFTSQEWTYLRRAIGLTRRQAQIARLICRQAGNERIALELGITVDTVRMHRKALLEKLRVSDRVGVPVRLMLTLRKR